METRAVSLSDSPPRRHPKGESQSRETRVFSPRKRSSLRSAQTGLVDGTRMSRAFSPEVAVEVW